MMHVAFVSRGAAEHHTAASARSAPTETPAPRSSHAIRCCSDSNYKAVIVSLSRMPLRIASAAFLNALKQEEP